MPPTPLPRGGFAGHRVSTRRAAPALGVVAAVALVASALMVSAPAPAAAQTQTPPFSDTSEDAFYSEAVGALADGGVFDGTECAEAMLCPGEPIDRKTMAVWIVRALDGQDPAETADSRFSDVDADSFHGPFIERMADLEVTAGCGDGTGFCPDGTVTRDQMAVFLTRAFELDPGPDPGFSDVAADAWYYNGVAALAASNITAGCGDGTTFCPRRHTTRAQMATFLARATGLVELPTTTPDSASPYPATIILPDTVVHVDAHGQRHIFTDDFTTDNGATRAALSPDGRQVAYTTDTALYVVDADGTNKTQLAQGGFASPHSAWQYNPLLTSWSPDSTRIAYTTTAPYTDTALYIAKADGTSNRKLTTINDGYTTFKWSSDSNRIAFTVPLDHGDDFNLSEDLEAELFIANADGTDARQIAGLAGNFVETLDFEWSPDGSRIAYVTPGGPALRVANADGTGAQRVVDSLFGVLRSQESTVQWSPDSSRIAACNQDGTLSIITASTGDAVQVDTVQVSENWTGLPCDRAEFWGTWVQWSPDSNRIAVATNALGVLCVISADGSSLGFEGYDISDGASCAGGGQETGFLAAWSSDSSSIAIAGGSTFIAHIDSTGGTYQVHDFPMLGGSRSVTYQLSCQPTAPTSASTPGVPGDGSSLVPNGCTDRIGMKRIGPGTTRASSGSMRAACSLPTAPAALSPLPTA